LRKSNLAEERIGSIKLLVTFNRDSLSAVSSILADDQYRDEAVLWLSVAKPRINEMAINNDHGY